MCMARDYTRERRLAQTPPLFVTFATMPRAPETLGFEVLVPMRAAHQPNRRG